MVSIKVTRRSSGGGLEGVVDKAIKKATDRAKRRIKQKGNKAK